MINFSVGPVQMNREIREIGRREIPYFRTPEFSALMKENERLINKFMRADEAARTVFLTGSGTAAMEAAVINLFTDKDKLLIVNGGSFGARFTRICQIREIPYGEICLESGKQLYEKDLAPYEGQNFTGFLVNVHETSTGVHYDMELISRFCQRNHLILVVDAISSFLADEFKMADWNVDAVLTGSQKALALPPGVSMIVLNKRMVERVNNQAVSSLYFNLKDYLKDGERGQTPFTPAVGILIQLNERLLQIDRLGYETERKKIQAVAEDFRSRILGLPLMIISESLSNAVTPLHPTGKNADGTDISARQVFETLRELYSICVCPNGGDLAQTIFRVGHIGNLTVEDNQELIKALKDMQNKGLL